MGGEGSGRKPDLVKQILNQNKENVKVSGSIASIGSENLVLPNFSGVTNSIDLNKCIHTNKLALGLADCPTMISQLHAKSAGSLACVVETTSASDGAGFIFISGFSYYQIYNNAGNFEVYDPINSNLLMSANGLSETVDFGKNSIFNDGIKLEPDGDIKELSGNNIDLYPENQTTIALSIGQDGTNLELNALGTALVEVGDVWKTTADQESADTEYFPNVLYGTDSTPPTASTVTRGSIYLQYTA